MLTQFDGRQLKFCQQKTDSQRYSSQSRIEELHSFRSTAYWFVALTAGNNLGLPTLENQSSPELFDGNAVTWFDRP